MKHLRLPFLFDAAVTADWNMTNGSGYHNGNYTRQNRPGETVSYWLRLEHKAVEVTVIVNYDLRRVKPKDYNSGFCGTTQYSLNGEKGYTFDRLGVESSFTVADKRLKDKCYGYQSFHEAAFGEMKRVQERRARIAEGGGFVKVPQLGYQITKKTKDEYVAKLAVGGSVSLNPSGFGHGYTLYKNFKNRYMKKGSAELAAFFDLPAIYFYETDHD